MSDGAPQAMAPYKAVRLARLLALRLRHSTILRSTHAHFHALAEPLPVPKKAEIEKEAT